jgi:hypothetical protein
MVMYFNPVVGLFGVSVFFWPLIRASSLLGWQSEVSFDHEIAEVKVK